jgi:hypothetical protein
MAGYEIVGRAILAGKSDDKHYWGVDSTTRVDAPLLPGDCRTFFKLIVDRASSTNPPIPRPPQFWGRYIGHSNPDFNLTLSEIPYLASQNCRLLIIYAGLRISPASNTGENNGIALAQDAISRAQGYACHSG